MRGGGNWWTVLARGYERAALAIAATPAGVWLFTNLATRIDRILVPMSGGRLSSCLGTRYHARHLLLLTATGARSGRPRTVPLLYFADGDAFVLVASKGGHPRHPAWYHNVRAHPEVTVYARGVTSRRVAREAAGAERERLWDLAVRMYPGYAAYRRRAKAREIPVIVLMEVRAERDRGD